MSFFHLSEELIQYLHSHCLTDFGLNACYATKPIIDSACKIFVHAKSILDIRNTIQEREQRPSVLCALDRTALLYSLV